MICPCARCDVQIHLSSSLSETQWGVIVHFDLICDRRVSYGKRSDDWLERTRCHILYDMCIIDTGSANASQWVCLFCSE